MNRAQRRALRGPVAELEETRLAKEREVLATAREVCAWIRTSTEPLAERTALVEQSIADLAADPLSRLFVGPALAELRQLRDDLATRAKAN